jgi:hypothetical protein
MASAPESTREAVLAILLEARQAGYKGLTRTSLVKYVYLLDVFVAEEKSGKQTWTDLEWVFHHFGPYSYALADCLDLLESRSFLEVEERSDSGREFFVYRASARSDMKPLKALGIPSYAISRLQQALRDFAYDLGKLLDFVYFRTAPMDGAHPQDVLRFDQCHRINYREDVRPVSLVPPTKDQVARIKALVSTLQKKEETRAAASVPKAIYDQHYVSALDAGDALPDEVETGLINATLEFRRKE